MISIWSGGGLIALAFVYAFIKAYRKEDRFVSVIVIAVLVGSLNIGVGFLAYPIAHSASKATVVGDYHQKLNGYYMHADVQVFNCTEGETHSNCEHTFGCDEWPDVTTSTDSKGNVTTKTTWVDSVCPVATQEFTYKLTYTTNGGASSHTITYADHIFAANPVKRPADSDRHWDGSRVTHSLPGGVDRGVSDVWTQIDKRTKAHDAPSMTVDNVYDNIILGTDTKDFEARSFDINTLLTAGLLPSYTTNLKSGSYGIVDTAVDQSRIVGTADKMQFVGMQQPPNKALWEDELMQANAYVGTKLQGDLYYVAVRASAIPASISPDRFLNAVKAYWESDKYFGKLAIPKNAVIRVFGVNDSGTTILWSRAETGMPKGSGNGELLNLLMLKYQDGTIAFDPDTVLGKTTIDPTKVDGSQFQLGNGIDLQTIGVEVPFARACMRCTDANEKGKHSYVNIEDLIPVSTGAVIVSILLQLALALVLIGMSMGIYGGVTGNTPSFWDSRSSNNSVYWR